MSAQKNPNLIVAALTAIALVAISAYQSSLVMPGSMCKPKAGAAKKK